MMSITQTFVLKMGGKNIFHENLSNLKSLANFNKPQTIPNNNYPSFSNNNSSVNSFNNKKQNLYDNFDILPKFVASQNMQEINKEYTIKILKKKAIFQKMVNTYFSENNTSYIKNLNEIESEINGQEMAFEYAEKRDYEGFKEMLSCINSNNTNENLKEMENMSLDDYQKISNENRNAIFSGIFNNKPAFSERLNLIGYYNNLMKKKPNRVNYTNNKFNSVDNMQRKRQASNAITKEQINLFKTFVGNPQIPDNHIVSYFDPKNPNVLMAAEKYFRNTYKNDFLTLNFYYPDKQTLRVHKFKFTSQIKELFMAAQDDYISMADARLFTESGKEIFNDKRYKCIGSLNVANNSKIKVVRR